MSITASPVYVLTVILLTVFFSEWLSRKKAFRAIGSSLLVIALMAVLANLGIVPSSQNPPALYGAIFSYIAPLAILFLLLDVKLASIRKAGLPMLIMFALGTLATVAGCLAGYYLISAKRHIPDAFAIAGMYTGTYTGGSTNLNAVALQYGVNNNGALFAACNAVDNIVGTTWIMVTLLLPRLLEKYFPRAPKSTAALGQKNEAWLSGSESQPVTTASMAMLLALGLACLLLSDYISRLVPAIPSMITLTTLGLVLAQLKPVQQLGGARVLGYFLVLVFLATVGAFCDIRALLGTGETAIRLLAWVSMLLLIHGAILFGLGAWLKMDWGILAVASNANVGGTATAAVCAGSIGRTDLQVPGLLVASIGNGIGTYIGIAVAEWLR